METCFNWCGHDDDLAWISSDEQKWKTRLMKLAVKHPEKVTIRKRPEENDGCIYLTLPRDWIRVKPPRELSEEQKAAVAERLMKAREKAEQTISMMKACIRTIVVVRLLARVNAGR